MTTTMRLSTRLLLFFLSSLAIVLVGFSLALYMMASKYLHRQVDERLEAVLNTLLAATETTPGGVEWEPHERTLTFGRHTLEGPFCWQVLDERGERLDGSEPGDLGLSLAAQKNQNSKGPSSALDPRGATWRVMRRVVASASEVKSDSRQRTHPARFHSRLILDAAVSLEGAEQNLRNLAIVLTGLSTGVWLLALVCGSRLCRHALGPVTTMARAAQAIRGEKTAFRLPISPTHDELEELGRSINTLLDRLQEAFERQRRFTGDASHQLRTPLTAILGQVEVALRQERDAAEYQRVLWIVERKTQHLRQIVESLLFLARADNEMLLPLLESIDLASWLAEHLRSWDESARGHDLRWECRVDSPVRVLVQPVLLAELLNNLLENAALHSEPGTPIGVSLEREGDWVLLGVEDEGIGIAPDEIGHLFEPFYRSATTRGRGTSGLGLGLAVADRLARSFKGSILVSSQPGSGSRFTLRLPLASELPGEMQETTEPACQSEQLLT